MRNKKPRRLNPSRCGPGELRRRRTLQPRARLTPPKNRPRGVAFPRYNAEIMHASTVVENQTDAHAPSACVRRGNFPPARIKKQPRSATESKAERNELTPAAAAACSHHRRCRGSVAPGSQKASVRSPPLGLPSLPLALR